MLFLEIIKNFRTGNMKSYGMITLADLLKKHPFCMDLEGWAHGGKQNTRFGVSNVTTQFIYVKTEETDKQKLEQLARSL